MKNKKLITIIAILASLAVLSVIIIVLILNDNMFLNNNKGVDVIIYEYTRQAESNDYEADLATANPENTKISDNEISHILDEDTFKEINEEDNTDDNSSPVVNESDVSDTNLADESDTQNSDTADDIEIIPVDTFDTITISAAGDVTLGRDEKFGWERTFDHELEVQGGDYGYFFRNVKNIFEADDLTLVNLETTLTTATKKAEKKYRFKADPSYVEILKQGNIEAASIANNHTLDLLDKGYKDTFNTLDEAGVGYFGYEHKFITEVRDIKIGVLGYYCMKITDKQKNEIKSAIDELRDEGTDLVIVMFHWGIERDYWPNPVQKKLAYFSIDSGADLVLGSHPHVLQGIDEYKGKQIVYSLANFCFGGNKNPDDKDTMIYVQRFNFKNGELISQEYDIIPCSISSVSNRNNYQPTPLEGKEAKRVLKKIKK